MNTLNEEIKNQNEIDEKMQNKDYIEKILNTNTNQVKIEMGFKTLMEGFDKQIFVLPKYQRKFVWTKEQVENLAISLITGLPIPPIYTYRKRNGKLEILDGQQRMISLFLYYKGKYFKKNNIELVDIIDDFSSKNKNITFEELLKNKGMIKDYTYTFSYIDENNKQIDEDITYNELEENIKSKIDFTPISVIEINIANENNKGRVLYNIFKNLNSGGTKLKNQEIRNGAYQSKFYDMIHGINNDNLKWRKLFGVKHKHDKDVELLLRFSATQRYFILKENKIILNNYNGSYPKFINDFSEEAINYDDDKINEYKYSLEKFIDRFDDASIKLPNLLLESLYFASIQIDKNYKINNSLCEELINDKEYKTYATESPSSRQKVEKRLFYVYKKLREYVDRYY